MKQLYSFMPLHVLTSLCLLFCYTRSNAQVQTARFTSMIANSNGYYEYLPQGYNTETQNYPLIIFLHGAGELGNGSASSLPTVLRNGIPKYINQGSFPASFNVNGQVYKFIVVSPQFVEWPSSSDVQGVIDYSVKNYRVNTSKIYLAGISMGGGALWEYVTSDVNNANQIAAIVPVCGASGPDDRKIQVMATAKLPIWATHNQGDPTVPVANTIGYVDMFNAYTPTPNPLARKTIFPVNGHDAWSATFIPSFRENNLNVYEWMLQYERGGAQKKAPQVNAGADVAITLPTNYVTLSGSSSNEGQSVYQYTWQEVAGPAQATINNGNTLTPQVTDMIAGDFTFRLVTTYSGGAVASDDVNVKVNAGVNTIASIPGKIEAESFNAMSGIQTENTWDEGGGLDVGWLDSGDWLDYNVNVATTGTYTLSARVATPNSFQQFQVRKSDGTVLATIDIPATGHYQNWTTVSTNIPLEAGAQTLRVYSVQNGGWNFNWLNFDALTVVNQQPAQPIPGKIEAESYNAMSGINTENTWDEGGGLDVGWLDSDDWLDYNVNVASAGTYTVEARIATPNSSQQFQIRKADGTVLANVDIPTTGHYQIWTTISVKITLDAGLQTLRLYSVQNGGWNINWLNFTVAPFTTATTTTTAQPIPGRIEAESYSDMSGIQTENTWDDGGGLNVGWIEANDWLDYNVNVASSGTYSINARVSAPESWQQFQIKKADGTVLATIDIPPTGSFQNWTTVSAALNLDAGPQTLRIYSVGSNWNINWLDFAASPQSAFGSAGVGGLKILEPVESKVSSSIYPNPVNDRFILKVSNAFIGAFNVQITDQSGNLIKTFKFSKNQPITMVNIPANELPAGVYNVKVQMTGWSDSKRFIKQ